MITRYFDLMLFKNGTAPCINVNQYDEGETWVFTLYGQSGVKYTPSSGAIVALKSDGHLIANAGTVDGQGRVVITETQQMTASAGKATCELQIDGDTHGTANFYLLVEPSPADGGVPSDSDLSLFQQTIDSVEELEALLNGETVDEKLLPIVQSETGDWLTDHITNPSNPPIDTSLTVAGAAADAKVTGEEITDLKSAISTNDTVLTLAWSQGGIDTSAGTDYDSNTRIRSDFIDATQMRDIVISLADESARKIAIYRYDANKGFLSYTAWMHYRYRITEPTGFYRIVMATDSDAALSPASAQYITVTGKYFVQESLGTLECSASDVGELTTSEIDILSTSQWVRGAIRTEDGTDFASNTRLRSVGYFDVSQYDRIKVSVDSGYKYCVYFYDTNKSYLSSLYFPGVWNTIDHIYEITGTSAVYMRLIISDTANSTSAFDMFRHFHVYAFNDFEKSNIRYKALEDSSICVMTYNAQLFTGRNADLALTKGFIDKYRPDVIGMTEYINYANSTNINQVLFSEYPYEQRQVDIPAGNAIFTKEAQSNGSNVQYTSKSPSGETRGYNKTYITIDGVKVALYNTHLEIIPTPSESRQYRVAQAQQLLTDALTEDYFIITGDFNTGDCHNANGEDYIQVMKPFIDAGCHSANGSNQHGFINTYYNGATVTDSTVIWCLDMIITSSNIDILNVKIDKSKLSQTSAENIDHLPVIAYCHIN